MSIKIWLIDSWTDDDDPFPPQGAHPIPQMSRSGGTPDSLARLDRFFDLSARLNRAETDKELFEAISLARDLIATLTGARASIIEIEKSIGSNEEISICHPTDFDFLSARRYARSILRSIRRGRKKSSSSIRIKTARERASDGGFPPSSEAAMFGAILGDGEKIVGYYLGLFDSTAQLGEFAAAGSKKAICAAALDLIGGALSRIARARARELALERPIEEVLSEVGARLEDRIERDSRAPSFDDRKRFAPLNSASASNGGKSPGANLLDKRDRHENLHGAAERRRLVELIERCVEAIANQRPIQSAFGGEREKEQLFFSLNHDLLALVSPIEGFARLMKSLPPSAGSAEYLSIADEIIFAAGKITRFVDDILTWGKARAGELTLNIERVDLIALLVDVVRSFAPTLIMRKISISINGARLNVGQLENLRVESLMVDIDRAQMERVFINLIDNATKRARSQVAVTLRIEDGFVQAQIKDDGPGAPRHAIDKLFDEFYQEGGKKRGVGLGLPTARRLIRLHRGSIMIDSDFGKGFRVDFSWPASIVDESAARLNETTQGGRP